MLNIKHYYSGTFPQGSGVALGFTCSSFLLPVQQWTGGQLLLQWKLGVLSLNLAISICSPATTDYSHYRWRAKINHS